MSKFPVRFACSRSAVLRSLLAGVALAAGGVFLFASDGRAATAVAWLPYLMVVACPLMYLFMCRHRSQPAETGSEAGGVGPAAPE